MKSPQPAGAPPWEISIEELEALVEQARAVLPEDGYKKLLGAVHTLRYVTELLEKKEASLADLRELLCPATTEGAEAGGHRHWSGEALDGPGSTLSQAQSAGPWAQRCSGV